MSSINKKKKISKLEPLWPLCDPGALVSLIAQVTNQPQTDVAPRLIAELKDSCINVCSQMEEKNIEFHVMSDQLEEFYKTSDAFLYETSIANLHDVKMDQQMFILNSLNTLKPKASCKIFCFGDGMGFDSARLAQQGHQVFYHEPGIASNKYAKQVFQHNHVDVTILENTSKIEPHSLDCIVCLDVLEHCEEPYKIVQLFDQWLKPDGLIISHAPFWMVMKELATHLRSNYKYTGQIDTVYPGFKPVDAAVMWNPIILQKKSGGTIPPSVMMRGRVRFNQVLLLLCKFPLNWLFLGIIRYVIPGHPKSRIQAFEDYYDGLLDDDKSK